MKKKISFRMLLLLACILPMVFASVFVGVVASSLAKTNLKSAQMKTLEVTSQTLKEYFQYDIIANGAVDYDEYSDHEYINMLVDKGIQQTLFEGDTRFLTSIKGSDGKYFENTKANADIWATVRAGKDYYAENVIINNKAYMVYYVPVYSDDSQKNVWGMAFSGIPMADVNDIINSMRMQIILIIVICCLLFGIILYIISRAINKTLKRIVYNVNELAEGDLSKKEFNDSVCNEFNEINASIEEMQDRLGSTVGQIRHTYNDLNTAVRSVDNLSTHSADEINSSSGLVSTMASTAAGMAENVRQVNSITIDLGNSIESISESSSLASERAAVMRNANTEALKKIEDVFESNENSVEAIIKINEQTKSAAEAVNSIKSAADVIANIAGQTNLLALNASIEAARAGESGRGFAVVAENIRELAEQSNVSAQDIRKSVEVVVSRVEECADMADKAKDMMVAQQELVKNVSDSMKSFSESVEDVVSDITNVSGEVGSLNSVKEAIISNVADLSAISEANASSATEVSTNMDNIATNISGTKDESNKMRGMAEELHEQLQYFK